MARKRGKSKSSSRARATGSSSARSGLQRRTSLAWKNFILFLLLLIVSLVLYSVTTNVILVNFFGILSIIFGFIAFAFLISLIVLAILKTGR